VGKTLNQASFIRKTAELTAGDHACFIFASEEEHRLLLTPFIRLGLEANEKVIYGTDTHTAETVIDYLRQDGMEVEPYLRKKQLVFVPSTDVYLQEGVFHPDRIITLLGTETQRALQEGFSALRGTGEMSWVLGDSPGSERFVEYEAKLNSLFPRCRCLALCQYDKRKFSPEALLNVLFTHPIVVVGSEFLENKCYITPENLLGFNLEQIKLDNYLQNLIRYNQAHENLQNSLEEIRNNEAKLQHILECIADGLVVTDSQGRITDIDEKTARMYGSSTDGDLIGKNVLSLVAFRDRKRAAKRMQELARYGITDTDEFTLLRADGSEFPAEIRAGLLKDAHGDMTGFISIIRDIGERKRMEERLRRSEGEMRTITENIPALISYVDEAGRYRFVNKQYEKWFGIKHAKIIGKHYRDVLGVETYKKIKNYVDAVMGGRHVHYEDTLPYTRGSPKWVMADYLPDTDERGKVRGFFALVSDITEQKQSEHELRERVKEWTCLCMVHRATQENLSIEELCGRVVQYLSSAMQFPDDTVVVVELGGKRFGGEQRRNRQSHDLLAEISAQGETYGQIEVTCSRDKPFLLPAEQDLLNTVADTLGVWFADRRAREELRRSRSNLDEAQKIGHLGSWEWDVNNGTLSWSQELYRIFGVKKGEFDLSYEGIEAMIHPDDRAKNTEKVKRMLSHGGSCSYEFRIVRPDGEIRYILQNVEVACGSGGKAERIFGTMQDITERKHIERELSRRAVELQQLTKRLTHAREQERARIAKELHDELGQALTAMRINVSQLEKKLQHRISPELIDRVRETGELADQLLRQTRDLALSLRPSMLDDLGLQSALQWYTSRFAERVGIEIDFKVEGREERSSERLRTVIYRTVQEALTNVARHARASKVCITLRFGAGDLTLQVNDDGKGFDVAEVFSIDSERAHLGLLGMRESVEEIGGKLSIQSSPKGGTSIAVQVPIGESP
jgi:two-component system sensor histidine kinase UhpB